MMNMLERKIYQDLLKWEVKKGFKLSSKNIGLSNDGIISIPLYMAIFL